MSDLRAPAPAPVRAGSPATEVLIDNDSVYLCYHRKEAIVHHQIRKFTRGEAFRELLEKGLDLFLRRRATKWLSDDRGNGAVTPADGEWALGMWAPRVIGAGWTHWAVVLPESVLGQMNMRRWIDTYASMGVAARAFTDPDEAMLWLKAQ